MKVISLLLGMLPALSWDKDHYLFELAILALVTLWVAVRTPLLGHAGTWAYFEGKCFPHLQLQGCSSPSLPCGVTWLLEI